MKETTYKLRDLAQSVQNYQIERGWSDAKLCKEISQVGSSKTYKRILDPEDDLAELNLETQLRNYEAAAEMVRIRRGKDTAPEPEYQDFANIEDSLAAIARALNEESHRRFVVIEGENGCGKDAVKKAVLTRWGRLTLPVDATALWAESAAIPLYDIIRAMDIRRRGDADTGEPFRIPAYPQGRLELIIEQLNKRKTVLLINEAHHMGPRMINLVKHIINATPTVVVFLCIPTLLNRLIKSSYEECIQLFGNRLCERVRLENPQPAEILTLLERRGIKFADAATADACAKSISGDAPRFGNWSYVGLIGRALRAKAGAVTLDVFTRGKSDVDSKRVPSRYLKAA